MDAVGSKRDSINIPLSADANFVVGIGASAGGLESLENFFDNVPDDVGMAFVVIQHLSPDFKSMMDELLARHTKLPIHRAEEGVKVEPGNIYLLPPKKEMIISGGLLHMADKDPKQLTLPIDHFFRSLAQDCGSRAVAVVLSGTGSDGSRGIQDVHANGGLVLCEDPNTAKFDGMPVSARETGMVDLVLRAEEMAASLLDHARSPHEAKLRAQEHNDEPLEGIEAIFELLHNQYDIDFSHYKPTTVSRRIERRLALLYVENLEDYITLVRNDDEELNSLYKDLLIGVTKFFRDEDPFLKLENDIIPSILQSVPRDDEIRVWIAGCATGEEPYSIAILMYEALEKAGRPLNVKIFATDVHRACLEHAGIGIYEAERLEHVSQDRLDRFFFKQRDEYQVSQELRQMIVFAQHNVIKDAPFTNLDLVSCRNLLIYFQPPAQKKAISLFHFGLKTGGTLLLGSSESPGELSDEFQTTDEHCKMYRKRRDIRLPADIRTPLDMTVKRLQPSASVLISRPAAATTKDLLSRSLYDQMLDKFMPPSLLVNGKRELLESFGGAERLLRMKGRRPSHDLLDLLDTEAKMSIAGALNRVIQHNQPVSFSGVRLKIEDTEKLYRLEIERIEGHQEVESCYLISLIPLDVDIDSMPSSSDEVDADEMSRDQFQHLESELRYTKQNLQASIEELGTSNEEMQATNEELVASNEELQSTNEELHSVNEELYTVNAEHQKRIKELAELNKDIEHLLRSTNVGIIYLDHDMCIRKFTPTIAVAFDLLPQDIGRKIGSFSHRIQYENMLADLEAVLIDGEPREAEVRDAENHCYLLRVLPYRVESSIEGAVLAMIDISILDQARQSISRLSAIVDSSQDAIIGINLEGNIETWNAGATYLYGYTAEEAIGSHVSMIVVDSNDEDLHEWFAQLKRGESIQPVEVDRVTKEGKRLFVSVAVSPVKNYRGELVGASSISRDITQLKSARREVQQRAKRVRSIIDSSLDAIITVDEQGKVTRWNPQARKIFGYSAQEAVGVNISDLIIAPDQRKSFLEGLERYVETESGPIVGNRLELEAMKKSGEQFHVELSVTGHEFDEGYEFICFIRDITDRREAEEQIRRGVELRDQFLAMLSHELRNPLSAVRTATEVLNSRKISPDADQQSRRVIERQTAQMTRLLDDLLDVSRITQSKIRFSMVDCALNEIVEDAVQSVQALAVEEQVTVEVNLPKEPIFVRGDPSRLQQIQTNLLANAIKYSSKGQQVSLELTSQTGIAVIRVVDNGAGISPELLENIFDMFVQSDETLDRSHGGMGVGLTLVRELVELHGGVVKANSKGHNQGSIFEVSLPMVEPPVQNSPAIPKPHYSNNKIQSIVIIEDQDDNRRMLTSLLKLEGFQVFDAASGSEGLVMIECEQPDAAIIDIGLPKIDGYEVARRVRNAEDSECKIKLLALTGYGQPQDVKRAFEAGFDHHLVKPLQINKLLELLQPPTSKV